MIKRHGCQFYIFLDNAVKYKFSNPRLLIKINLKRGRQLWRVVSLKVTG